MKVKELIKELQRFPPDAYVVQLTEQGSFVEIQKPKAFRLVAGLSVWFTKEKRRISFFWKPGGGLSKKVTRFDAVEICAAGGLISNSKQKSTT